MTTVSKKKISLFGTINSRKAALEVIQQSMIVFGGLGIYQLILSFKYFPSIRLEAIFLIALALLLALWKSRLAAIVILLLTGMAFITGVLEALRLTPQGFVFVFIALVLLWLAIKVVEATFKLHGRLANEPDEVRMETVTAVVPPQPTKPRLVEWGFLVVALLVVIVLLVQFLLVRG